MMNFRDYIIQLNSYKCQCGEKKKPKTSFCPGCFNKLPFSITQAGYLEIRRAYLQFYGDCLTFLNK
jgi:hypothetical protein